MLRFIAVGMEAQAAQALIRDTLPGSGLQGHCLGSLASVSDFAALGPDLQVDFLLWAQSATEPEETAEALRELVRVRPRCGVLILLAHQEQAQAGPLQVDLATRRRRGEIPPTWASSRRDLRVTLRRLLAELGWPTHEAKPGAEQPGLSRAAGAGAGKGSLFPGKDMTALLADVKASPAAAGTTTAADQGAGAHVILCYGPKGGVGKTTLSVSLAATAARARPGKVVLLDLDLTAADASVHLGHFGGPDLIDLLPQLAGEPPTADLGLHRPRGIGLQLVAAPQRPELAELVSPQHIRHLLTWCRRRGFTVVVDAPAGFGDELVLEALAAADHLLLITTADPTSLRLVGLAQEFLEQLQLSQSTRLWLVVNQVTPKGPISIGRIESFLGQSVSAHIPLDRLACQRAVAAGRPLVNEEPSHPISQAILRLGGQLGWLRGELSQDSNSSWVTKTLRRLARWRPAGQQQ